MLENYRESIVSKHSVVSFDGCLWKVRSCYRISRNFIVKLWVVFKNYKTCQSKYRFTNKIANNELFLKLMYHYEI